MRSSIRALALSGMLTGLSLVILTAGSLIGVGTYAAAVIAGIILMPLGMLLGRKYQLLAFIATGLMSFILLSDREEALMYVCLFGWYPIAKPRFDALRRPWGMLAKGITFNLCAITAEALTLLILAPASESTYMLIAWLILFNILFWIYDKILPRLAFIMRRRLLKKPGMRG